MATDRSVNILIKARDQASAVFGRVGASGQNLVRSLSSVKALVGAGLGFAGLSVGVADSIKAFARQEEAEARVRKGLAKLGLDIDSNLEVLKAHAAALQATTTAGDETTLMLQALALQAGATVPQAAKLASAAVHMSAALGKDATESARALTKTLAGTLGELGDMVPATRALTREQLQAGRAIDLVAEAYRGAADAAGSYERRWKQLMNSIGDLQESAVAVGLRALGVQAKSIEAVLKGTVEEVDRSVKTLTALSQSGELSGTAGMAASAGRTMFNLSPLGQWSGVTKADAALRGIAEVFGKLPRGMTTSQEVDNIMSSKADADAAKRSRFNFARNFLPGTDPLTVTPDQVARAQAQAMARVLGPAIRDGLGVLMRGRDSLAAAVAAGGRRGDTFTADLANKPILAESARRILELRSQFDETARRELDLMHLRERFAEVEERLLGVTRDRAASEEVRLDAEQQLQRLRDDRLAAEKNLAAEQAKGTRTGSPLGKALAPMLESFGLVGFGAAFKGRSPMQDVAKNTADTATAAKDAANTLADLARNASRGSVVVGVLS